jgi:hypothetical protein
VTANGFRNLGQLTELEELTDAGLDHVAGLVLLEVIRFRSLWVTDAGLTRLTPGKERRGCPRGRGNELPQGYILAGLAKTKLVSAAFPLRRNEPRLEKR